MKTVFLLLQVAAIILPLFTMSGCIMQYQRQYLGDPIMLFDGNDPEEKALEGHIFPRREGSSGGDGGAGGGCGC